MGRSPCSIEKDVGLKKGPWTPEEDQKLLAYIQEHGPGSWRALPPKAGLQRCGKSCRLRWTNYLRPDIKRGKFSMQEEQTIIQLHALLGNRWSAIASHLPKRTDNEIKNHWNTHLKKRLTKMGIDPNTHKPKSHTLGFGQPKDVANISHMAQWESARLEAEARIVRESKLIISNPNHRLQLLNKAKAAAPPAPTAPPVRPPCLDILKVWQGAWTKPITDHITTTIVSNIFASNGTLESPTSILNFSENKVPIPTVESSRGTSFTTGTNFVGNHSVCAIGWGDNNYGNEVKGIMENLVHLDDITGPICSMENSNLPIYAADSLMFSNFTESFTDLPPAILGHGDNTVGAYEENKVSYIGVMY